MHRLLKNSVHSVLCWWKRSIFMRRGTKSSSSPKQDTYWRASGTVRAVVDTVAGRYSALAYGCWWKHTRSGLGRWRMYVCVYRMSQEEWTKLRESVPYVELYRYNPKHLYPKLNGYGDKGQGKVWASGVSTYCTPSVTPYSSGAHARQPDTAS